MLKYNNKKGVCIMNITERRMEIHNLLQKSEFVDINELAEKFGVTTMTIRRDLKMLERQGIVSINYGRAYMNKDTVIEPSFSVKIGCHIKQKSRIGKEASEYVEDGDTIIVDCGTTVLQMIKYITNKRITIITNSWPVINYASSNSKIKLIVAPGEYNEISAGAFGNMTIEFIKKFHADKVFIGSHGCSIESGATVPEIIDAEVKRSLLDAGKQKLLLVDSTKFGDIYLMKHAELSDFDYIITNDDLDFNYKEKLRKVCKNVIFK